MSTHVEISSRTETPSIDFVGRYHLNIPPKLTRLSGSVPDWQHAHTCGPQSSGCTLHRVQRDAISSASLRLGVHIRLQGHCSLE